MKFTTSTVAGLVLAMGSTAAFSTQSSVAFVSKSAAIAHVPTAPHPAACGCAGCHGRTTTRLFVSETAAAAITEVPVEVESLDGIESKEEAHNSDRPARSSLKKKTPKGRPLSEFKVGDSVTARVKSIATYGAFMDIGATTDGLLHISNLSSGFVKEVKEFLTEGQELEVRIININEAKNQVGLTLLTSEEEEASKQPRPPRQQQRSEGDNNNNNNRSNRGGGKRDDSAVVAALAAKGFDRAQFVEGTVASTVDFGAFVRFDASKLNPEVEGEMDGLVHISALTEGRANSVTSVVNVGDKVKVRCLSIEGRKVSLSMISVEQTEQANERRQASGSGSDSAPVGAKDWKESLERIRGTQGSFTNSPLVVDLRK